MRRGGLTKCCHLQLALVLLLPFLACVVLTLTVGPANFSLRWSLGMGLLYVAQTALLRNAFLEQQYKVQSLSHLASLALLGLPRNLLCIPLLQAQEVLQACVLHHML